MLSFVYLVGYFKITSVLRILNSILSIIGLLATTWSLSGQNLRLITQLPKKVHETSGIELTGSNQIWTFNDSGGEPEIYLCDTSGQLLRTIRIQNAWNRDWEDITQDDHGNFYIGNIGNNNNSNTDLTIFKIPNPALTEDSVLTAETISFKYEDQNEFPPSSESLYFDAEALFWHQGHLYVTTKNRTQPFDGKIRTYRLPDTAGTYVAKRIATWSSGGSSMMNYWVTAGDLSPDGSKLCLLSSDKLWIFYDFPEDNFFAGKHEVIPLNNFSQKEAVCFLDETTLYITDEELLGGFGRNLYALKITSTPETSQREMHTSASLAVYPNPCKDWINVEGDLRGRKLELFDEKGLRQAIFNPDENSLRISFTKYPAGVYYLKMKDDQDRPFVHKVVKSNK